MAKEKNTNKQVSNRQNKVIKDYRNPVETLWGKILIWILLVGMVGGVIFGLIMALINMTK